MFSLYGFMWLHLFEVSSTDQSAYLKKLAYVGDKYNRFLTLLLWAISSTLKIKWGFSSCKHECYSPHSHWWDYLPPPRKRLTAWNSSTNRWFLCHVYCSQWDTTLKSITDAHIWWQHKLTQQFSHLISRYQSVYFIYSLSSSWKTLANRVFQYSSSWMKIRSIYPQVHFMHQRAISEDHTSVFKRRFHLLFHTQWLYNASTI